MPNYFLDSSAVVKYYHPEVGSDVVTRLLNQPDGHYFISRLATVEVQRAFVGKVRAKQLPVEELEELSQAFADDITLKRFIVIRLTGALYSEAEKLVRKYGPADTDPLLRTLDALQLASALEAKRQVGLDHFVSADKRQGEAAEAEQFSVINPAP